MSRQPTASPPADALSTYQTMPLKLTVTLPVLVTPFPSVSV
jgi:hypothetical protein